MAACIECPGLTTMVAAGTAVAAAAVAYAPASAKPIPAALAAAMNLRMCPPVNALVYPADPRPHGRQHSRFKRRRNGKRPTRRDRLLDSFPAACRAGGAERTPALAF